MIYPKDRFLFTVKDVCHTCGVSRATLIRMEESGFLKPYRTDDDTGYRYYDADNIAQIGQYQLLQKLGLSRKEITDFYFRHTDMETFIKEQRIKVDKLQRILNELEIRFNKNKNFIYSFTELPDITCYCSDIDIDSFEKMETRTFEIYQETIKEGFRINGLESIFMLMPEYALIKSENNKPMKHITVCIPINSEHTDNPHIKKIPGCHAFSLTAHGEYSIIPDMMKRFMTEMSLRKLKPSGPARCIFLVATYTGNHIPENEFCFEFIVPVENE